MRKARIEIIPMIDTIFFLLVFFMIASLTMVRMRAMAVALPKNTSATTKTAGQSSGGDLILTLTDSGQYFLGKQPVGYNQNALQAALINRLQNTPPRDVVLNLGKLQNAQSLISVLDVLNRARVASKHDVPALIATEPVDQDGRALPLVSKVANP